jgi:hypothetical protein
MALENGLQIWQALLRSGLEPARKHELPGYDAELVARLKEGLYPKATRSFEQELRSAPPSTEMFLDVFFNALKPFSEMLREVLAMFESAGARRSDENLRIAFDFDKASKALALTLKEFREVESFFRKIARPIVERRWTSDTLWLLSRDVESVLERIAGPHKPSYYNTPSQVRDLSVREWIERNGRTNWLPFPGFPRSDDLELDKIVALAEALVDYMIAEVMRLGTTYQQFTARLPDLPTQERGEADAPSRADELPRRNFVIAAHDFWPNTFAENVCLAIEAVKNQEDEGRPSAASQLGGAIQAGFERPPRTERTRVTLEQDFLELINIPIWKKRHELYAVWVGSRIADALSDLSWDWHPDGDTLRFSFSGVELATISTDDSRHVFWTEKRTALAERSFFGRKHIQPDYRIMTVPTHCYDATSLVVECKQYRKWSKRNFGIALDDYAKGCPKAPIILVNYGPSDPSILTLVEPSRRDRTFLVGNFKPFEEDALNSFRNLVHAAYPTVLKPQEGTIAVSWGPMYRDLDLHLFIQHLDPFKSEPIHVGFGSNKGSLTEEPWVEWSGDTQRSPPGTEQITIARWLNADYDVLVHDYSGTLNFPNGEVRVRIDLVPGDRERLLMPPNMVGRWWHVCRIRGPECQIENIDQVLAECPFAIE